MPKQRSLSSLPLIRHTSPVGMLTPKKDVLPAIYVKSSG
jgi:hypothetical protein